MDINNLHQIARQLEERIAKLADAEQLGYAQLKPLSRELLEYVPLSGDIAMVNRLLQALKPVNRKACVAYFSHFLPWVYDETVKRFDGKMKSDKRIRAKAQAVDEFLSEADSSLYSWKKEKAAEKEVDYIAKVTKAVGNALDEGKGKADVNATLAGVLAGGVSLEELAAFLAAQAVEVANAA